MEKQFTILMKGMVQIGPIRILNVVVIEETFVNMSTVHVQQHNLMLILDRPNY